MCFRLCLHAGNSTVTFQLWYKPMQVHQAAQSKYQRHLTLLNIFFCCAEHLFYSLGLTPCALATTSASVGTVFVITFSVFDDGSPQLQATVNRTLLIVSPCSTGAPFVLVDLPLCLRMPCLWVHACESNLAPPALVGCKAASTLCITPSLKRSF